MFVIARLYVPNVTMNLTRDWNVSLFWKYGQVLKCWPMCVITLMTSSCKTSNLYDISYVAVKNNVSISLAITYILINSRFLSVCPTDFHKRHSRLNKWCLQWCLVYWNPTWCISDQRKWPDPHLIVFVVPTIWNQ